MVVRLQRRRSKVEDQHVYKTVELTGSSPKSTDEAIRVAVERASKTLRNIKWVQVLEQRGHVENGKVAHWQVTMKVGFTLEA
jgi:flavin-binding protein dodecin